MVDQKAPFCYNSSIINQQGVLYRINYNYRFHSPSIWRIFLGYCLGRCQGYYKGAEMAESIYRKQAG